MEKNKNIFLYVNNSEYYHQEMGLMSFLEHLQLRSLEIPQKRHGQSLVEFPNIDSRKNQNFKM